ncbi:MAG: hypothetical protein Q8O74_05490 [bacterium]|nr:hypothetical protein [bacterium]
METVKQEVSNLLTRLSDECSLEDVQYHLYVLQKIERGLKDAAEGRVYTQVEVEKRMAKPTLLPLVATSQTRKRQMLSSAEFILSRAEVLRASIAGRERRLK